MTTLEAMKFFLDPLTDPFTTTDKVYVTEERTPRGTHTGKIVEVDNNYRNGGRMWWVTKETKDYVLGHALNYQRLDYSTNVIGWREGFEEGWFVGQYQGIRNERALLGSVKYFNQVSFPALNDGDDARPDHYEHADMWLPAAEWALELMPAPTDSAALVRAKLALAEQRWTQRKAKVTLMIESMVRNYSQLDSLIEDGDMPLPKFGAVFVGSILMPAGRTPRRDERTVSVQEQIDALQAKVGASPEPSGMFMAMRVETPLPLEGRGRNGLDTIKLGSVRDAMQTKLDNYDVRVTDYHLTPILRGAISGATS